jgi:hypothetical protein
VEERSSVLVYLGAEPVLRPLAGNARLRETLARSGLDLEFTSPSSATSRRGD